MTEQAFLTMLAVLGSVWGGFSLLLLYALRRESRKSKTQQKPD